MARTGARTFWTVEHYAVTSGRDGAVRIGAATIDQAGALRRKASAAGSRGWSKLLVYAPRAWRRVAATASSLAREARSASARMWARARPVLRRAWAACMAGFGRAAHELATLAHSASERLSAYVDSRTGPR